MLLGKDGVISPEQQALIERNAEAQRLAAAKEANEVKRAKSLTNAQLGFELRKAGNRASKVGGTGLKICNVDFGPVPANGIDAAMSLILCAIVYRDLGEGPGIGTGSGRGGANDPYCLRTSWRPKYGRTRNWPRKIAAAAAKKAVA